jgi:transcriptional regulator with XRE-family HTH domain
LAAFIPALPFCHAELRAPKPKPTAYPRTINTLGDHIRARRLDLNLLQKHVGERIGVDALTITNWECNATAPAIRYIPAILSFLDYDPFPPAQTLPERLATVRKALGLSQRNLALSLGVDSGTLQSWEAGQHEPIGRNVELIERFLETFASSPALGN